MYKSRKENGSLNYSLLAFEVKTSTMTEMATPGVRTIQTCTDILRFPSVDKL